MKQEQEQGRSSAANALDELRRESETATVLTSKIAVSKTYNLGNYQAARLEAECSIPETDVQDRTTLSRYYMEAFQALDEAFRRNFQNKQQ